MLGKGVARLLVVTLVAFGTWSPFLCDFGFVFGGCVMLVASFNMFVVEFKHVRSVLTSCSLRGEALWLCIHKKVEW